MNGDLRVAYRASRDGRARHRVRPELVHLLRGPSGATVPSRVGRGDDIARSADLLRPAGHGSVRSRLAGRVADLGAMGRQHHRGARRSRESRSGAPVAHRRVRDSGAVRRDTSVSHHRAGRARGLRGSERSTHGCDPEEFHAAVVAMWGTGEIQHVSNPDMPWNEEIRATWARHGTPGGEPGDRRSHAASADRNGRAGVLPDNPRANARRSSTPTTR